MHSLLRFWSSDIQSKEMHKIDLSKTNVQPLPWIMDLGRRRQMPILSTFSDRLSKWIDSRSKTYLNQPALPLPSELASRSLHLLVAASRSSKPRLLYSLDQLPNERLQSRRPTLRLSRSPKNLPTDKSDLKRMHVSRWVSELPKAQLHQ
jgi:hypothetical protein